MIYQSTQQPVKDRPFWASPEDFFDHFLSPFYKASSTGSFGKLWSSILLATSIFFWVAGKNIPDTMVSMIQLLLLYTFGNKGLAIVRDKMASTAQAKAVAAIESATQATTPVAADTNTDSGATQLDSSAPPTETGKD